LAFVTDQEAQDPLFPQHVQQRNHGEQPYRTRCNLHNNKLTTYCPILLIKIFALFISPTTMSHLHRI